MKFLRVLCFLIALFPTKGFAQESQNSQDYVIPVLGIIDDESVFGSFENWSDEILRIKNSLKTQNVKIKEIENYRKKLANIENQALEKKEQIDKLLSESQKRIDALGEKPKDGEAPELETTAKKRKIFNEEHAKLKSKYSELMLVIAQLDLLDEKISDINRKKFVGNILIKDTPPINPIIIANFVPDFFKVIEKTINLPSDWWNKLSSSDKKLAKYEIWVFLLELFVAVFLGLFIRKAFVKKYGVNKVDVKPPYNKKVLALIVNIVAKGAVPILVYLVIYHALISQDIRFSDNLNLLVKSITDILFFLFLARLVNKSVLMPYLPAWSVTHLDKKRSIKIKRTVNSMVYTLCVLMLINTLFEITNASRVFYSVSSSICIIILSFSIYSMVKQRFWLKLDEVAEKQEHENHEEDEDDMKEDYSYPMIFMLVFIVCLSAVVCSLFGYVVLGGYLVTRTIFTFFVIGMAYFVREMLLEGIKVVFIRRTLRQTLRLKIKTLRKMRFILSIAITPVTFAVALFFILPFWGVPKDDIFYWAEKLITGFSVGGIKISLLEIAIAILAFSAVFILTGILRKTVTEKVLAETNLDESVKQSLGSGVGYIGIILATTVGIAVLGVNLDNIAMLAGALSVGIGFGLQNIVNNFVSGVIILIERPIKVGDWVVVNGQEGFVKQINIRATELETWQKASIIIPNADILSNFVTNLTHKDRYGRIEISVGVAYGSDTQKVKEILLNCAKLNKKVARNPKPQVLFRGFGDSSLDFELRCFTANVKERRLIASNLRFEIDASFRKENVEIPFPQRVVHFPKEQS